MDNLKEVLDNYKEFCLSVSKSKHVTKRAFYATGLLGEVMELFDLYKKKHDLNRDIKEEDLKLESGDVLWYLTVLADACSFDLTSQINNIQIEPYKTWYLLDSIPEALSDLVAHAAEIVWNIYNEENGNWVTHQYNLEEIHEILVELTIGLLIFFRENKFDIKEIVEMNVSKLKNKWGV